MAATKQEITELIREAALANDAFYEARKRLAWALTERSGRIVDEDNEQLWDMIGLTNPAEIDTDLNCADDFIDAADAGEFDREIVGEISECAVIAEQGADGEL